MQLWTPQDNINPRHRAEEGREVWVEHSRNCFVSNMGRVRDVTTRKELTVRTGSGRYPTVSLRDQGRRYLHQVVLEAFDGPGQGRTARRRNLDKEDNRLCNLYWSSARGRLSPTDKALLQNLLERGVTQADIGRQLGIPSAHVAYYKKKLTADKTRLEETPPSEFGYTP